MFGISCTEFWILVKSKFLKWHRWRDTSCMFCVLRLISIKVLSFLLDSKMWLWICKSFKCRCLYNFCLDRLTFLKGKQFADRLPGQAQAVALLWEIGWRCAPIPYLILASWVNMPKLGANINISTETIYSSIWQMCCLDAHWGMGWLRLVGSLKSCGVAQRKRMILTLRFEQKRESGDWKRQFMSV